MAVFAKHDKPSNGNSGATIIASGTKITGQIDIDCNLHIDGEFEGTIRSKNVITVGKSGVVNGEVVGVKMIVSGKFTGTLECETVEILPQGRVDGKIISKELVIERKGYFVGESKLKSETSPEKPIFRDIKKVDSEQPLSSSKTK